jgi:hypothetical protein
MQVPLIRLQCGVNSYDWGKVGKDSAAAKFAAATPTDDFSIQEDKPYAEVDAQPSIIMAHTKLFPAMDGHTSL